VLVMEVERGSPAALTGLKEGDTIVGFKGQPIVTIDDLHKRLVASEIGVSSPIMFLRGTEKLFRMIVPRELPPPRPVRRQNRN
jgi:S1-C subfamily serine protease